MNLHRRQFLGAAAASLLWRPDMLWAAAQQPLDVAYVNARVWTGGQGAIMTDAIGTVGPHIAALGADAVKSASGPKTRRVDLGGAFLMPGFIDNHSHFVLAAPLLVPPVLRQAKSRGEFAALVAKANDELPKGQWMVGGYWDAELWGGELPTREWIDAVTPDRPVALTRLDLHSWLLNSVAMKMAGIDRNTVAPNGGKIIKDAKGEPTGIVIDEAQSLVKRVMPPQTDAQRDADIRRAIQHALSVGVTQTHAMSLDWILHEVLLRLRARGETDLRFYSYTPLKDWEKMADIVKRHGRGDDWVRWGGMKVVADGSLGSRTARFHQPYDDDPKSTGMWVTKPEDLREWSLLADKAGLQLATHAIGDEANDVVLDIIEAVEKTNGPRDRRPRIEHAQHLTQAAIPRFAQLGVTASVQPYHAIDDGRWAIQRIGAERLKGTYAFKSLMDTGANVCFGSDWPVAPIACMTGVAAAVLRETIDGKNPGGWMPQQKISVQQALLAYTAANAWIGFQDDRLGKLAPGYLADFTVLEADPFSIDPEKLATTRAVKTIVNGVERYSA